VVDTSKAVVEGTVDVVTDPVKAAGDATAAIGTVAETVADGAVATVNTVAEVSTDAVVGVATDVTDVGAAVVDFTGGAITSAFDALGVNAAFQSVFGADIDKSDEGLEASFGKVDADGSGKISADEMKAYISKVYGKGLSDEILDAMMKAADTDGDGEIDLDEFKKIMRAGPDEK